MEFWAGVVGCSVDPEKDGDYANAGKSDEMPMANVRKMDGEMNGKGKQGAISSALSLVSRE